MRLVKRVLPNGRVEYTRTFYAIFVVNALLTALVMITGLALIVSLIAKALS